MGIFRNTIIRAFAPGAVIGGIVASMTALGVPGWHVYAPAAAALSAAIGLVIGPSRSSRKPDYRRIAELEQEIFGAPPPQRDRCADEAALRAMWPGNGYAGSGSGWQASLGTVSVNAVRWHSGVPALPPSAQSAAEVAKAFESLARVVNFPQCPACGSFSGGSTAFPLLCQDCAGLPVKRKTPPPGGDGAGASA